MYRFSETIEDHDILLFIKQFSLEDKTIGAISSAPLLLLKAGLLKDRRYLAGVDKEWLYEEGFTKAEFMTDVPTLFENPIKEGFIKDGNLITSLRGTLENGRWNLDE